MTEQPVNYGEPVQVQPVPAPKSEASAYYAPPAAEGTSSETAPATGPLPTYEVVPSGQLEDNSDADDGEPFHADEPKTVPSLLPNQLSGDDIDAPPAETGVVTAAGTHPSVMVRFADVLAHVENWFGRHPEARGLEADLKSGLATMERHGGPRTTGTTPYQDVPD